jgi:hypothetical protein
MIQQEMEDQGYENWETPEVAQYVECTGFVIENQQFYMQLGCADGTSQALAVNIYKDNECTQRSVVDGYDDSNIDVSEVQVRAMFVTIFSLSLSLCNVSVLAHFVSSRPLSRSHDRSHSSSAKIASTG